MKGEKKAAYEDTPGVKKRKLQWEQMAVGLNNSQDDAKDIMQWKNVVMTPAVCKVVKMISKNGILLSLLWYVGFSLGINLW